MTSGKIAHWNSDTLKTLLCCVESCLSWKWKNCHQTRTDSVLQQKSLRLPWNLASETIIAGVVSRWPQWGCGTMCPQHISVPAQKICEWEDWRGSTPTKSRSGSVRYRRSQNRSAGAGQNQTDISFMSFDRSLLNQKHEDGLGSKGHVCGHSTC